MTIQRDEIIVVIAGVTIEVRRLSSLPVPHEVTVVIPRAEFRKTRYQDGQPLETTETILNSITVAHSPRHPRERRSEQARTTWKYILHR